MLRENSWSKKQYVVDSKKNLFIFHSIVKIMYQEDNGIVNDEKSREFGVLGDVLRTLQREEMEEIETCLTEIQETGITQNTIEILTEMNATLKEIAVTQKKILEEIKNNRNE